MRFKIDWASLIVGSKFIVLLCFTLCLRAFSKYKPPELYIWRGDSTEGFLCYEFRGLIFGGAYFRNFTVPNIAFSLLLNHRRSTGQVSLE